MIAFVEWMRRHAGPDPEWHIAWLAGALFILLLVLALLAPEAGAVDPVEVAEAEVVAEGVDGLTAALIALVTAVAGWLGKQGSDSYRRRNGGQGAPQAPTGGGVAEGAMWKMVVDDLAKHEADCAKYRKETREEIRRLHGRIDDVARDVADIKADVAYLRGKADS